MTQPETFQDFIASLGYTPPERIEPGRWISFSANGKRSNTAGRCKLFPDQEGGIVFDWRTGESHVWQVKRQIERTAENARRWREKIERDRQEATADRERELEATKKRAAELWEFANSADDSFAYLRAKGVKCHGSRIYRGPLALNKMRCDGALMIPRRDGAGKVVQLQFIAPDGDKRYLNGPMPPGSYFSIGKPGEVICIAEGYATGATIHEATGYAVAVAFDAANLEPTAKALRAKFPDARLILAGDDDWKTLNPKTGEPSNTGLLAATAAARAVCGDLAIPKFGDDREDRQTDFNDQAQARGLESVKAVIERAQPPQEALPDAQTALDVPEAQSEAGNASKARLPSLTAPMVQLISGDSFEPEAVRWLMPDYLPCGKVVLIGGQPGTGKTTLAIALAAAVSSGGRFPDGTKPEGGNVLMWSGEDSFRDTLGARFKAAGANMGRVHFVGNVDVGTGKPRGFDPAQDVPHLLDAARSLNPRVVIVDPIVSAVQGDSHKNAEVRRALAPLVDFAEASGAVVLGITHFSKGSQGKDPTERITGSLAFAALARVVLVCAKVDEEAGGGRVMVRAKSNLGPDGGGFRYDIRVADLGRDVVTTRIVWGEPVAGNARDILATAEVPPQADEDRQETQGAAEWLRAQLEIGELLSTEVERRAREAGFPRSTVQRAAKRIGAVKEVTGFGSEKKSVWRLPANNLTGPQDSQLSQLSQRGEVRQIEIIGRKTEWLDRPPWEVETQPEAPKDPAELDREAL